MRHFKTSLAVIGGATILVLAGNTVSMAATGHSFLLGKSNSADANTSLTRTTSGSVLKLQSKSSANSPLTVNGTGKVSNLNADSIDGLDSSSIRTHSYVFTSSVTDTNLASYTLPVPDGTYLVSYSNFFSGLGAAEIQCYVENGAGTRTGYSSLVYVNDPGWKPSLAGTGLATKTASSAIKVVCQAVGSTWSSANYAPMQIVVTPTKQVSSAPISPARVVARHAQR